MALKRRNQLTPELPAISGYAAVNVCHPEWRGVRTAAYATRYPVIESANLTAEADAISKHCLAEDVNTIILQGWPTGAATLADTARAAGLTVLAVSHSSMAQHSAEAGEARAIEEMTALTRTGVVARLGFVKAGVAQVFMTSGLPAFHVPNRTPLIEPYERLDLGAGRHVGVFAEPIWRKNLATQLGATHLNRHTAHMLTEPVGIPFWPEVVVHGVLDRTAFLGLLSSTDLNMYVSLSECHPLTPIESYLVGVPCLISRTSDVFRSDAELWELTSMDTPDNPTDIAARALRLIETGPAALAAANAWILENDALAEGAWSQFIAQ